MTMWVVGVAAVWLVGAGTLALLLGAVLRRGRAVDPVPEPVPEPVVPGPVAPGPAVRVPAQRTASTPVTPPHGLRSQAHLNCAGSRAGR